MPLLLYLQCTENTQLFYGIFSLYLFSVNNYNNLSMSEMVSIVELYQLADLTVGLGNNNLSKFEFFFRP